MNAQSLLPRLREWFEDYVTQFSSNDPILPGNMDLKANHTRKDVKPS